MENVKKITMSKHDMKGRFSILAILIVLLLVTFKKCTMDGNALEKKSETKIVLVD